MEDAPKIDSSALFAMVFGSEKFEPLIGELKIQSQMSDISVDSVGAGSVFHSDLSHLHLTQPTEPYGAGSKELASFRQRKRILQCALNLAKKLDEGFVLKVLEAPQNHGLLTAFRLQCSEEAKGIYWV